MTKRGESHDQGRERMERLLSDIVMFLDRHPELSPSQFGFRTAKSPSLLPRLRRGATVRRSTERRIRDFMGCYRPTHRLTRASAIARKYSRSISRNMEAERKAALFRATDEVERAKRFLRSRGHVVFAASVIDPALEGYRIGTRPVDKDGLLNAAKRHGWEG